MNNFNSSLLVALNAKYSHTALAVRCLKSAAKIISGVEVCVLEMTINHSEERILRNIVESDKRIVGFSVYIWNVETVLKVAKKLKMLFPEKIIIFGGPEVSYDPESELYDVADHIVTGEGEYAFSFLISNLEKGKACERVVYSSELIDLDRLPFVYAEDIEKLQNKIIYYESSRGCPFNCSYCLSSTTEKLRYAGMEKVKRDILTMIRFGSMQVKFVDRTFNSSSLRALEIMKFIAENDNGITNFHFEITASIMTDQMFEFLKTVRSGLFQFEIGLQTSNPITTKAIGRQLEVETTVSKCKKIVETGNFHVHLDLIAGLPYEDAESFIKSINVAFGAEPHMLQIGFLKMLKGSRIRSEYTDHEYIFDEYPPYEVMSNKYLTYEQMCSIKDVEEVVESIYNSGFLRNTVIATSILEYAGNYGRFLIDICDVFRKKGFYDGGFGREKAAFVLLEFIKARKFNEILEELLIFEATRYSQRALKILDVRSMNEFNQLEKNLVHSAIRNDNPEIKVKEILKKIIAIRVKYDIVSFINSNFSDIVKLSGDFNVIVFSGIYNSGCSKPDKSNIYRKLGRIYEFGK